MNSKKSNTKKVEKNPIYLKIDEITEYLEKRIKELRAEEKRFRERVLKNKIKIN